MPSPLGQALGERFIHTSGAGRWGHCLCLEMLLASLEILVLFMGWEVPLEKGWATHFQYSWASLVAQLVKNPPAMGETWVQSDSFGHPDWV